MPIIYDADAEQVREETDDPRLCCVPSKLPTCWISTLIPCIDYFRMASSLPLNYAAAGVCTKKI